MYQKDLPWDLPCTHTHRHLHKVPNTSSSHVCRQRALSELFVCPAGVVALQEIRRCIYSLLSCYADDNTCLRVLDLTLENHSILISCKYRSILSFYGRVMLCQVDILSLGDLPHEMDMDVMSSLSVNPRKPLCARS